MFHFYKQQKCVIPIVKRTSMNIVDRKVTNDYERPRDNLSKLVTINDKRTYKPPSPKRKIRTEDINIRPRVLPESARGRLTEQESVQYSREIQDAADKYAMIGEKVITKLFKAQVNDPADVEYINRRNKLIASGMTKEQADDELKRTFREQYKTKKAVDLSRMDVLVPTAIDIIKQILAGQIEAKDIAKSIDVLNDSLLNNNLTPQDITNALQLLASNPLLRVDKKAEPSVYDAVAILSNAVVGNDLNQISENNRNKPVSPILAHALSSAEDIKFLLDVINSVKPAVIELRKQGQRENNAEVDIDDVIEGDSSMLTGPVKTFGVLEEDIEEEKHGTEERDFKEVVNKALDSMVKYILDSVSSGEMKREEVGDEFNKIIVEFIDENILTRPDATELIEHITVKVRDLLFTRILDTELKKITDKLIQEYGVKAGTKTPAPPPPPLTGPPLPRTPEEVAEMLEAIKTLQAHIRTQFLSVSDAKTKKDLMKTLDIVKKEKNLKVQIPTLDDLANARKTLKKREERKVEPTPPTEVQNALAKLKPTAATIREKANVPDLTEEKKVDDIGDAMQLVRERMNTLRTSIAPEEEEEEWEVGSPIPGADVPLPPTPLITPAITPAPSRPVTPPPEEELTTDMIDKEIGDLVNGFLDRITRGEIKRTGVGELILGLVDKYINDNVLTRSNAAVLIERIIKKIDELLRREILDDELEFIKENLRQKYGVKAGTKTPPPEERKIADLTDAEIINQINELSDETTVKKLKDLARQYNKMVLPDGTGFQFANIKGIKAASKGDHIAKLKELLNKWQNEKGKVQRPFLSLESAIAPIKQCFEDNLIAANKDENKRTIANFEFKKPLTIDKILKDIQEIRSKIKGAKGGVLSDTQYSRTLQCIVGKVANALESVGIISKDEATKIRTEKETIKNSKLKKLEEIVKLENVILKFRSKSTVIKSDEPAKRPAPPVQSEIGTASRPATFQTMASSSSTTGQGMKRGRGRPMKEKKPKQNRKPSDWILFVKSVAKSEGLKYGDALKVASLMKKK